MKAGLKNLNCDSSPHSIGFTHTHTHSSAVLSANHGRAEQNALAKHWMNMWIISAVDQSVWLHNRHFDRVQPQCVALFIVTCRNYSILTFRSLTQTDG